jgi:hypothetical protein
MWKRLAGGLAAWVLLLGGARARANMIYQVDKWPPPNHDLYEVFNNSATTETEDNWGANSYQAVAGGTRLTSFTFLANNMTNQRVSAVVYLGSSLTDPHAGGGLTRVETTNTTVTAHAGTFVTITLDTPVDLPAGQIFYAALLLPSVSGATEAPFATDRDFNHPILSPPPLGRSFFDVGPTRGAPYNLDNTGHATVLGGRNPVVGVVQDPGNLVLRVNATASPVPAPPGLALALTGVLCLGLVAWRRKGPAAA